jgi:O-antigen/teichoic acid export membrane protein
MHSLGSRVVKNASINIVRLAAFSIVALFLPPFLVRHLTQEQYSTWALIIQISSYVVFLDFGLQASVGRFVAWYEARAEFNSRDQIASTALALLAMLALLGSLGIIIAAWFLPSIFRQMPATLVNEARLAVLVVGLTLSLGLPVSALNAIFIGKQRNEIPVAAAVCGRVLAALLIMVAVLQHRGISGMAVGLAVSNVVTYVLQAFSIFKFGSDVRIAPTLVTNSAARELSSYAFGVAVWITGGLLINGLDTTIVGLVQFREVGYYALAATVVLFVIQFQDAVMSALLPAAAVLGSRNESEKLGEVLLRTTRCGTILLLLLGIPLIVWAPFILRLWVGSSYAIHVTPIFRVLAAANMVRLVGLPYAQLVLGTGQQKRVLYSPLCEGIVNVVVSIVAGKFMGAVGVALGTLVGAFVGMGYHVFRNMPRTSSAIRFHRKRYFVEGIVQPVACYLPLLASVAVTPIVSPGSASSLLWVGGAVFSIGLIWNFGLHANERERLISLQSRLVARRSAIE